MPKYKTSEFGVYVYSYDRMCVPEQLMIYNISALVQLDLS